MTQDEIIEMARQAGMIADGEMWFSPSYENCDVHIAELEAFAKFVAAKEREACALRAEDFLTEQEPDWDGDFWNQAVERVAMAIRARGEA
jgi:hypothetical protein